MPKYRVTIMERVAVTVTVEARSAQKAQDVAQAGAPYLDAYVGNGGDDRLVGTCEDNVSLSLTEDEPTVSAVELVPSDEDDTKRSAAIESSLKDTKCPGPVRE